MSAPDPPRRSRRVVALGVVAVASTVLAVCSSIGPADASAGATHRRPRAPVSIPAASSASTGASADASAERNETGAAPGSAARRVHRPVASTSSPARRSARFSPPVEAPVRDPFREPSHAYGPGNRGLEYAAEPGTPVRAIGAGRVAFAGPVAGRLVISIDHPGGLRSSLTDLASIDVYEGAVVHRGQVVGTATALLHLGVRRDGVYIDPATLFAPDGPARLVAPP